VTMFPFARPGPFPYHRAEGRALHETLVRDVHEPGQIDQLVRSAAPSLPPLNPTLPIDEMWRQGLTSVARAGALATLCERLCEVAWAPAVQEAARAMLAVRPAVERHIHGGRVVVDRTELREAIGLLGDQNDGFESIKVLLVRGGPRSGKSWSRHLFEQAARDHGAMITYLDQGAVATVDEVIRYLFALLDCQDRIPGVTSTPDAWYRDVVTALRGAAAGRKTTLWIAVDGLGPGEDGVTPLLDPSIREFFDVFALRMVDPAISQWFRLLLIHYPDGRVPTRWDNDLWREDRTDRDKVDAEAVAAVLRERLADRNEQAADETVSDWAEQVIAAAADAPGENRLQVIQRELVSRLRALAGGPS
jgi:hypothetical protein